MRWLNVLVSFVLFFAATAESDDLVVQIDSGKVSGWESISRDGRVYQAWTGIPYAEPPTGELRLKAPKPARKWEGILNTTGDPPVCLQPAISHPNGEEDCLYLNVYRPKNAARILPVIVHVHGGAFQLGYSGPRESADYLMDEDVVLVRIQYRLSVLGFMSLADTTMPGNFGLKDQVMALKWVKQNIAAFGGNPNSVTVVGESAGGASAHLLLKSPACDDLVHRAVSDSGTINKVWSLLNPESVRNATLEAAQKAGCLRQTSKEILECLQELEASKIINLAPTNIDPEELRFLPVIEPEGSEDAVATFDLSLRPTKKPWITSTCTGEWGLFKEIMKKNPGNDVISFLRRYFSIPVYNMTETRIKEVADILAKKYFSSDKSKDHLEEAAKMQEDIFFYHPLITDVKRHLGLKWIYSFEHNGEISRLQNARLNITEDVVAHASPAQFYFNMRSIMAPGLSPKETPEDYEVSKRLIKYLVNFAYYDNPTPDSSPSKWLPFENSEVLKVSSLGDYLANHETIKKLAELGAFWDSILGW